jgi:tetratricopeptide (TPR) repeat protein
MQLPPAERLAQAQRYMADQHFTPARSLIEGLVADHPELAEAHYLLGLILHDAGLFSRARAAFEAALQRAPGHTEATLCLAVLHNDMGHYGLARQLYQGASAACAAAPHGADPYILGKLADMHVNLAHAYAQAHLHAAALGQLQQAQDLCPQRQAELNRLRAGILNEAGDFSRAAQALEDPHASLCA